MGVLAAVAVSAVGDLSNPVAKNDTSASSSASKGTEVGAGVGASSDIQAGLTASCVADFDGLSVALQTYEALHGAPPTAGRSWFVGSGGAGNARPSWPSLAGHFGFSWNGNALLVAPQQGSLSSDSAGSVTARTGCFATSA